MLDYEYKCMFAVLIKSVADLEAKVKKLERGEIETMSNMIIAENGAFSKSVAFRRVLQCKRMLSEMGYDPETGIFDALKDLAALKTKQGSKSTRVKHRPKYPADCMYGVECDTVKQGVNGIVCARSIGRCPYNMI